MKKNRLITTRYTFPVPGLDPEREENRFLYLALVSDLHDRDPRSLLRELKREKPDLILLAGDILERKEEGYENHTMEEIDSYQEISGAWSRFCNLLKTVHRWMAYVGIAHNENIRYGRYFLKKASAIAPVYFSMGNHEWYLLPEDKKLMKKYHITVLDNADCEVNVKGIPLRIGGLSTRHDLEWLDRYAKKDGTKILLCHHPEYYKRFLAMDPSAFALVLSGHAHGGQWRFFGRGILSPGQGLLPELHHGIYKNMIISAGVANTFFIPRFGNPCELVMIQLHDPLG